MKQLLTIFSLLLSINAIAGHRYVSSSVGNDGNTGLDSAHPYKSLTKVNSIYSTLAAGDTILFKRGDTFLGQLSPMRSGLAGLNMVITSYGSGAKPIISGLIPLHTWTLVSGNIWQCTPDSVLKANTNILTFNGIPQAVGRTDWLHYSSATATQLTSSTTLSTSYLGAEVVVRKKVYIFEKAIVTAQSGNTLTYSNANEQPIHNNRTAAGQPGQSGYGFFLQRFAGSLDQQGEWYFDKTANKVKIYSTTNPNSATIKISFKDTIILLGPRGYTTISNIALEGASVYGVESYGGTSVTVTNCDFRSNTLPIYMWNTTDAKAEYNSLENSLNSGIVISNNQSKRVDVNYNYIHNTSPLIGLAIFNAPDNLFAGILARTDTTRAQNYVNVIGNKVINTGHCPINFKGSNSTIRRNYCDTFAYQQDDMGGIYTFNYNDRTNPEKQVNQIVDSNFISNAIGAPLGKTTAGGIDVAGLYFDDQSCNVIIRYNTVWNIPGNGIQLNNPLNMTVQYNTVYNCDYTINENRKPFGVISGVLISNNVLYPKITSQYNFYTVTNSLTQPSTINATQAITQLGTIDSNWVSTIKSTGFRALVPSLTPPEYNITNWRSNFSLETHSTLPPVTVTGSNTRIITNPSDADSITGFAGARKITPKGTNYDNYILLPKWTSKILIDNGTANIPPVANAGGDVVLTLPTNSTAISASASTDADGSISAYAWTQISGPNTASLPTSTLVSTGVNGLIAGLYKFQLKVTDNGGVSSYDTMQVTVNAAVNQLPHSNAGSDFSITLPPNSTSLTGSGSDADGTITYSWSQISGPSTSTFGTQSAATTTIGNLSQGVYSYELAVTDNSSATVRDTVFVTVNAAANMTPVSIPGSDRVITLPQDTVHLAGSGTDPDGSITAYAWTKISGPSGGTIVSPTAPNTVINSLQQGLYVFELMVTDNYAPTAGTATKQLTITVNQAPNVLPHADASIDRTIDPPRDTITIFGSGTDSDGTIDSYLWRKILGPAVDIDDVTSASIIVSSLVSGTYQFELEVTDDRGGTAKDTMTLVINQQPFNLPPTASAGPDRTIYLPRDSVTLFGSGSDVDGTVTYYWSGSGGTITNPTSATPLITGLGPGTYTFAITVRDNQNAVTSSSMTLTVVPEPVRQKRVLLGIKVIPQ